MSTLGTVAFGETYDHLEVEQRLRTSWDRLKLYEFNPNSGKPVYSIDTPPPYVSAAHLHVGHAMSYAQAEFVVRYRRMRGYSIYYPMGFDDNGLPTERYVERTYRINKHNTTRSEFRRVCLEETAKGAAVYEKVWRALGLSVDWRERYSTIDSHSRRTSQKSFLDLFLKGLVYRADEPVLWDTADETALAQADLETLQRKSKMYDIVFEGTGGKPLVISTTRPELLPACVGLFHHPDDARYAELRGGRAKVPLFGHDVPILQSEDVDKEFGTGLMMTCTFGDGEDVNKWRAHHLDTRVVLTRNGRMNERAGPYTGLQTIQARAAIVKDLVAAGVVRGEESVDQAVSVGERSQQPIEFQMVPQWFIRVLDSKDEMLARSAQLEWNPPHMKARLDAWITGLKYDWNISRQRFYGVPFPVWYVEETGDVIVANEADLPVDPTEDSPPGWAREKYAGMTIRPEQDVMDTWMTSSVSPYINLSWAGQGPGKGDMSMMPMSLRVQAFEIIRTWLFYTLVKAHYHRNELPWTSVMISGWGLNEQGKKIAKRDLEASTDASGYNRYVPDSVIEKYGADALRYWAAAARLGNDLRYNEKDVRAGRKIVVKLFNVAKLAATYLADFDVAAPTVPITERAIEDRWMLGRLDQVTDQVTAAFESYDYAVGREALEKFFWTVYCDNYVEIVKDRFWHPEAYPNGSKPAAQATLWESLRRLLAVAAPYLPFVTDEVYLRLYAKHENAVSIHVTAWPEPARRSTDRDADESMQLVLKALDSWRYARTNLKLPPQRTIRRIDLDVPPDVRSKLHAAGPTLRAALRCQHVEFGPGELETGHEGWRLAFVPGEGDGGLPDETER
ncbi:MAG TPA: valine--tRNA ligase [Gemmatimonadaceae bacterium]